MAEVASVIAPTHPIDVAPAASVASVVVAAAVAAPSLSAEASAKLRVQIEFYFCDANFRRDKFLRAKAGEDADGFVGLDVIATFNRVKSITTDPVTLGLALDDSDTLELSEDRLAVRRGSPLPETDDSEARSVVAKAPFPAGATLEQLQAWAATFGVVARLVMRRSRTKDKPFRGSIIIEFATHEGAAALVTASTTEGACVYEGAKVARIEMLKAYYARKKADREAKKAKDGGKAKAAAPKGAKSGPGAEAGAKAEAGAAVTRKRPNRDAPEVAEDDDEAPKEGADEKGPRAFEKKLTPGVILRLSELGQAASIDSLQLFLNSLGELKFAEYDPVTRTANARFENAS